MAGQVLSHSFFKPGLFQVQAEWFGPKTKRLHS